MKILIAYGTTEGQTRAIAERAAMHLRERGHTVELRDSAAPATDLNFDDFDAFVVAASVHQEQHQGSIKAFAAAHHARLNERPSAFISVSLSAVLEETRADAQSYVDRFLALTKWQPAMTLLLGGALRFDEYDYFQKQIVKFIVMKRGMAADETGDQESSNQEFTDWDALAGFLEDFLRHAGKPSS